MSTSGTDDAGAVERQREQVRSLCRAQRYEEAADLAAMLSEAVLLFVPCEQIADHVRGKRPAEAARLYAIAAETCRFEGTQATGSGEGLAAMDDLRRVEGKLRKLRR